MFEDSQVEKSTIHSGIYTETIYRRPTCHNPRLEEWHIDLAQSFDVFHHSSHKANKSRRPRPRVNQFELADERFFAKLDG